MRLAAQQHGVLRRDQVLQHMSADQLQRRLSSHAWVSVLPRVYRVEGAPPCWRQRLRALCLWAGQGFALSHGTAAALHGFRRFPEGDLEVSVLRNLAAPKGVVVHRVKQLHHRDLVVLDGFRVTNATRTLLDLSGAAPEALVRASVDQALARKWTTLERLSTALLRPESPRGRAFLRTLVHEYQGGDGPCESELEARFFELLDNSGLPRPDRQRRIFVGGRWRRVDFSFAASRVIVEADGYAYHCSPIAFEKDRQRINSLISKGYRVLHWTWKAMEERPAALLAELATVLAPRAP